MARPPKTIKPVPLNMSLDGDIAARIDKLLFSELEQKIPHGARSALINQVLRKYFRSEDAKAVYARTQLATQIPGFKERVDAELEAFVQDKPVATTEQMYQKIVDADPAAPAFDSPAA